MTTDNSHEQPADLCLTQPYYFSLANPGDSPDAANQPVNFASFEVPLPVALQLITAAEGWLARIKSEGESSALLTEITTYLTENEAHYPEAPVWDWVRGDIGETLFGQGSQEASLDLIASMRSYHRMAASITSLSNVVKSPEEFNNVVVRLAGKLITFEDRTRYRSFAQALIDQAIRQDPANESINTLEAILTLENPDYDPIGSWAESQRSLRTDVNWDCMAQIARNEKVWIGVPRHYRQHELMLHADMLHMIMTEVTTESVEAIRDRMNTAAEQFPKAAIWDEFRFNIAIHLLQQVHLGAAMDITRSMNDSRLQQATVAEFLKKGYDEEALELAELIKDPKIMAETLLNAAWIEEDRGVERLAQIIQDENYPVERRIACLEFLHRRSIEKGLGEVKAYASLLRNVKKQQEAASDHT